MKGQITLEYLVLAVVLLSILSLSIYALFQIKENAEHTQEFIIFSSDVNSIDSNIKNVCSLGSGNSRILEISTSIDLSYEEGGLIFIFGNYSIPKKYSCGIEGVDSIADFISIENIDGSIEIH